MDPSLEAIRDRIARAAESVDRDPRSVTLIAVSKMQSVDAIRRLYDAGQRDFGESRLQEAIPKIESLPTDIRWHFIGKLQSNKVKRIAELFALIHTLDSDSQLKEFGKLSFSTPCMIEVNIGEESQKGGIFLKSLDDYYQKALQCKQVDCRGLMVIGPDIEDAEAMRPYFRALAENSRRLGVDQLSMGMSRDFDVAIQEGATHVRVGTALFGGRN